MVALAQLIGAFAAPGAEFGLETVRIATGDDLQRQVVAELIAWRCLSLLWRVASTDFVLIGAGSCDLIV